jgi:hypothetical protein
MYQVEPYKRKVKVIFISDASEKSDQKSKVDDKTIIEPFEDFSILIDEIFSPLKPLPSEKTKKSQMKQKKYESKIKAAKLSKLR